MEKLKIQKKYVTLLYSLLELKAGEKLTKEYIEFCIKNRKTLEVENEIILKRLEKTEKEIEYLKKEWEIINNLAKKNENDELQQPVYIPKDNISKFNNQLNKLKKEYSKEYSSIQEKAELEKAIAKEELEIELNTIEFDKIPNEITTDLYQAISECNLIKGV